MAIVVSTPALGANVPVSFDLGPFQAKIRDITLEASYTLSGAACTPATLGFTTVVAVIPLGTTNAGTSRVDVSYDYANQKLKALRSQVAINSGAPAQGATGAYGVELYSGALAFSGSAANLPANPTEAASTEALSAVTVRVLVIGIGS